MKTCSVTDALEDAGLVAYSMGKSVFVDRMLEVARTNDALAFDFAVPTRNRNLASEWVVFSPVAAETGVVSDSERDLRESVEQSRHGAPAVGAVVRCS